MSSGERPERRLTGNHITIMVVAALVTLIPSAGFAVVAATHTTIVSPKGQPAYVSNNQLNVRGVVGTADFVPTGNLKINRVYRSKTESSLEVAVPLIADASGNLLAIGQISMTGFHPGTLTPPQLTLYATYVGSTASCPTDPPQFPDFDAPEVLWTGTAQHQDDISSSWTFPIPLIVTPRVDKRTCLYGWVAGYDDAVILDLVGARGTTR